MKPNAFRSNSESLRIHGALTIELLEFSYICILKMLACKKTIFSYCSRRKDFKLGIKDKTFQLCVWDQIFLLSNRFTVSVSIFGIKN